MVGTPATGMDPAQEAPRETVLLAQTLARLTPEDARLVRKVVCELLPLPPAKHAGDRSDLAGVREGGGQDAAGP